MVLAHRLSDAGFDVRTADNGRSGIEVAQEWQPQAIVLDIRMPGMDGFEVNRALKDDQRTRDTPVIFLSANVQDTARETALAAGAFAFLTKPYDAAKVIEAVRGAVGPGADSEGMCA